MEQILSLFNQLILLQSSGGDEAIRLFDIKLFDTDFWELLFRFTFNVIMAAIIVRYIYYPITKNKDYSFTYMVFNPLIFFVCYFLGNLFKGDQMGLGLAFGMFAVFSILRYRTITIEIREMTYLFIVITVAVINALSTKKVSYAELLFVNFTIVGVTAVLETLWQRGRLSQRDVIYEKIENIVPEKEAEMLADLRQRTGLDIQRFEIIKTDFLRDTALVRVYFAEPPS